MVDACLLTQKMKCTFSIHSIKFEFSFFPVILNIFSVYITNTDTCVVCYTLFNIQMCDFASLLVHFNRNIFNEHIRYMCEASVNQSATIIRVHVAAQFRFIRNENIYTIASVRFTSSQNVHMHYARIFCPEL